MLPPAREERAVVPESDAIYYRRREAEERAACARSADPMIADIHSVMAERYAAWAWSFEEQVAEEPQRRQGSR